MAITAIPPAGHRGVDLRDDFVDKQETFQDALSDVFVDEMNVEITAVNADAVAAAGSETNAAASETAAGLSETAAGLSETNAATSETAAGLSETAAGLSESDAEDSNLESGSWANENEDVLVKSYLAGVPTDIPGTYSAKHYATKVIASEAAAGLSETNAAASETAAGLSETAAGLSETAAGLSETAAGLSETNAAASETAAGLSETNAAASETAAGLSETAAGLSETNAAASETAAGLSETAAGLSETAAGLSETNAAASETAAGLSETAAGLSETNAEDSNLESGSWANENEDVLVKSYLAGVPTDIPDTYSSLHHAAKAAASALSLDLERAGSSTAVGYEALLNDDGTVRWNTAVGYQALTSNTSGAFNGALGGGALFSNLTGNFNTAVGYGSLAGNTTGFSNVALGARALEDNISGSNNTALGESALNQTISSDNTAVGSNTSPANTTGSKNVSIGNGSFLSSSTGIKNTTVGYSARLAGNYSNCTSIGASSDVTGDNQVQLGDSATTTYVYGTVQNRSDANDKAEIRDTVLGLSFIEALRPVDYKWNLREDYTKLVEVVNPDYDPLDPTSKEFISQLETLPNDGSKTRTRFHHGLIAQEVEDVIVQSGVDFGGFQDHTVGGGGEVKSLGYDELVAPLIKAVQELSAKVVALEAKV